MKQINFVSSLTGTLLCSFAYDWQERGRATDLQGLQILTGVALGGLLAPAHKGCRWNVGWKKDLCRQTESEEAETTRISDRPGAVPVCCWGSAADARKKGPRAFRLSTVAAEIE